MAAQKGRLFLLSIGDGAQPTEAFTPIATARTTEMTINSESVDVTAKDTNGWSEKVADAGMKSMTISLEGVFKDTAYDELLRAAAHAGAITNYELESENGDVWSGAFHISSYSRGGAYNGEETFSATLESAGEITFTPAA